MTTINKRIAFSVPPDLLAEFEALAREEQCTKSELFCRVFRAYQKARQLSQKTAVDNAICS
jgi:metal-responsive CopG/Arc/MetJ family transcriptional regulator